MLEEGEEDEEETPPTRTAPKLAKGSFKDPNFYMDYKQKGADEERGYSLSGGSFAEQARHAVFDLNTDEATLGTQSQRPNAARWDTKKKKFIKGDGAGSDNKRLIRTESGLKLPASFRSGRFDEWRREQRVDMPKVGSREEESPVNARGAPGVQDGKRQFRHNKTYEPKIVDRKSDKWAKNSKKLLAVEKQKKEEAGNEPRKDPKRKPGQKGGKAASSGSRRVGGAKARNEVKSARDILKARQVKQKRMEKNARPSKKGKKR